MDFLGTDTFTYRASDGTLTSENHHRHHHGHEVNDAPVALDDVYTAMRIPSAVAAPGVVNDTDTEGDPAVLVADAAHGTLALALRWFPSPTSWSLAWYRHLPHYQANDGLENSTSLLSPSTRPPVNDAPVADDPVLS